MRSSLLGAIALSAGFVSAFRNTSPLFIFSSSELVTSTGEIVTAPSITQEITSQLKKCFSDTYVVVSQPGVNTKDYSDRHAAPHLRKRLLKGGNDIRSSILKMEVLGEVSTDTLIKSVEQHCGAGLLRVDASTGSFQIPDDTKPRVINVEFPPLPVGSQRASKLLDHDAFLSSVLDFLPSQKYTVIYTTSVDSATDRSKAVEPETYEMDTSFSSQAHVELKRDFIAHERRASSENVTLPDGALFERYQYFTPGIFMGLVVAIPLLLLLYVAISGVASLQVSYAAFDKETGPAAQNKQQ